MDFDFLKNFVDIILHLDKYLEQIVGQYQNLTYLILFLVIFAETGLVVAPFLPGDSLLFAAGSIAALGSIDVNLLFIILFVAAVLGDTVNYSIGKYIGPKVFKEDYKFLKKEYLYKAHSFYEKYGGKTIIIARFIPIIRTFAPFVAGIGEMTYAKFIIYNIVGGLVWCSSFIYAGYFFGNISIVKKNFTIVIFAIILISILPAVIEIVKGRMKSNRTKSIE
jgi:membrane-associated protein